MLHYHKEVIMIISKFGLGQQVRHKLLGFLGVVIDIDPEYSLEQPKAEEIAATNDLRFAPWYHVVMENEEGQSMHIYLAEAQLDREAQDTHPEQSSLDELAHSIRRQLLAPRLRN